MFSLAVEQKKLGHDHVPNFPRLDEDNVRTGFFEHHEYESIRAHLPEAVRPVIAFAYRTGWRIDSEVLPLEWRQVDLKTGEVRLHKGTTKNGDGRVIFLSPELRTVLADQRRLADQLQREHKIVIRNVFFYGTGAKAGKPITVSGFYKVWRRARKAAGCPARIPHDFRRTAVRNMVRAGIPERVAMQISGHRTRSVFERYNIVRAGDLQLAAGRLDYNDSYTNGYTNSAVGESATQNTRNR
jgi:integrase